MVLSYMTALAAWQGTGEEKVAGRPYVLAVETEGRQRAVTMCWRQGWICHLLQQLGNNVGAGLGSQGHPLSSRRSHNRVQCI